MPSDYFCILAGGGVRGTAYLGVFKMLEEAGINVTGLAGSSIGAVFAALYAAGYKYDELREIIFNTSYQIFRDLHIPTARDFGVCKGENLYTRIKTAIELKFYGENFNPKGNKPVTFKDLHKDLIIVATNISCASFKEYSEVTTPDVEVAYAVRASISIPGFFKPVWEDENCLVDGDVINNFPIWIFSDNKIANDHSKILEFRLEGERSSRKINNLLDYFSAILDTSYNISTDLLSNSYGKNDQFDIIRVNTGNVQVIDFNISNEEKEELIIKGYECTKKYIENDLLKKKERILAIYQKLEEYLQQFRDEVAKDRTKDSLVTLGNISIFVSDNKDFIHKKISSRITELRRLYLNNLSSIKLFNLIFLKNKNDVLPKFDRILKQVESKTGELETYLFNAENPTEKLVEQV